MISDQTFFDLITPGHLYLGALFFAFITAVFVIMIYVRLYIKKRRFFARQQITSELNDWISEALVDEDPVVIKVSPSLRHYLRKPVHRQYVVDSLINVVKNISGAATDNIKRIYEQLGLKEDSIRKLRSIHWYKRSRGIYELYMMGQREAMADIARYTDSNNEVVRSEAQTATVGFNGFNGLSFLTTLTHPLTEWQQLKLLEQLNKLDQEEMPDLPLWLTSSNSYVQLFALKLTDIYQQFGMYDLVIGCLSSPYEHIRRQATITIRRITGSPPEILKERFMTETNANKRTILKQFGAIGSAEDLSFLQMQLLDSDDSIKLEAGRAMVQCNGWTLFEELARHDETLTSIAKQVKYEAGI